MFSGLNDSYPKAFQPDGLNIELMEHQKTAIKAMEDFEKVDELKIEDIPHYGIENPSVYVKTNVGILGDKVGSGKSLMIVGFIMRNQKRTNSITKINVHSSLFVSASIQLHKTFVDTCLLIVPQKLIDQWKDFISYAPELKMCTIASKYDIDQLNTKKVSDYNVILVTDTKISEFVKNFNNMMWNRIFIDECDSIKIPKSILLATGFLWFITGTPKGIIYKSYAKDVFGPMVSWLPSKLVINNDEEYIKQSIELPRPNRIVVECYTSSQIKIIGEFIPKSAMALINAGNLDMAINTLGCKVEKDDNIVKIVTNNIKSILAKKTNELEKLMTKHKKLKGHHKILNDMKIKEVEKKIKSFKGRLDGIKEKLYTMNDELCPICMDEYIKPTMLKCCSNIFCLECIALTVGSKSTPKCPCCSKVISKDFMILVDKDNTDSENSDSDSDSEEVNKQVDYSDKKKDKMNVLLDIVKKKPNGKFLVFANYPETFKKIQLLLDEHKITNEILKGTSKEVGTKLKRYEKGEVNVLLLNATFFGAGMNLQMTTDIIMFHRFTKEMEEQIVGRAQRLGRSGALNVYYLLHQNESATFEDDMDNTNYEEWLGDNINILIDQKQKVVV